MGSIRLSQETSCAFQLVGPVGFSQGKSHESCTGLEESGLKGERAPRIRPPGISHMVIDLSSENNILKPNSKNNVDLLGR